MPDLLSVETQAWADVAAAAQVSFGGVAVVCGPGAHQVGDALLRLGCDTVVTEESTLHENADFAPTDTVDTVVMLHAWGPPSRVDAAAHLAVGWLRPGGTVVLADLAVRRLRAAPSSVYPSAHFYREFSTVGDHIERRSATTTQLAMAAVRAGIDGKTMAEFERPVGVFASPDEHRAAVEFGAWRGLERLDAAAYASLLAGLGSIPVSTWPLVEIEPWSAAVGTARY